MGFQAEAGAAVSVRFTVPHGADRLVVGVCVPEKGGQRTSCQAALRRANGDTVFVFRRSVEPGPWEDHVLDLAPYRGEAVALELVSGTGSEIPHGGRVYWSTPVVVSERGEEILNVILISIDSLRADHLGCYGYHRATTPNLDSLASTGYLFARAIAQSSWTLPSHASLLTSLYVKTHGACGANEGVSREAWTLAEGLREAGYFTAGFATGPFLLPQFGLNQGFDSYDARCSSRGHGDSHHDVTNPCLHRRVMEWVREWGDVPFFLFLHYWDVHYDYIPPAPYDTLFDPDYQGTITGRNFARNREIRRGMPEDDLEHIVALYDGEIAYTDAHLGLLFRELRAVGLSDRTLIVVTSDHGDEFLEHGATGHGHTLFQELIRVPIIWAEPWQSAGPIIVDDVVQLLDVAPTILDRVGLEWPTEAEGRSILPLLRGRTQQPRTAFSETRSGGFLKAAVRNDVKILRTMLDGETRAYDLRHDPAELSPSPPESVSGAHHLESDLGRFLDEGKVTLEIRVAGGGEVGELVLQLMLSDPPMATRPHALESDDTLTSRELPPTIILELRCPEGDVDGIALTLPSANSTVRLSGTHDGEALEPDQVVLGMGETPGKLPVTLSGGNSFLRVPPTNIPVPSGPGPRVSVWKVDERALATARVQLDKDLAEYLRALGYLQ
jgi:arylsulfatase A-like enzyme